MMKALFVAVVSLLVISAIAAQSAVLSTEPFMDRLCSQGADETWAWYEKRLETTRKIVSSCGSFDVVFIGDSITQGWENTDVREIYAALRRDFRILNLGYNGDTTSHVLWRLQHGELDGYRAKLFMVMIGTNNEGDPTTAEGVSAIVRLVRAKHPESRILLLPIFPMGAKADAPARVQRARESAKFRSLADGEKVVWLDFNKKFLEPDGTLTNWMAPDLLHLSSHGYAIWSEAVRPMFERYATDPGFADGLVTWSMAEGVASKDGEYRVTVDGRPLDVVYVPKPSMHDDQLTGEENLQPYYAVFFDADREVEVVVESPKDLSATRILPSSRGVKYTAASPHRVSFRAKPPFKLSFEPTPRHRALIFSANVPETDVPVADEPGVKYFGPGRHHFDEPIHVRSGETLYLAPGSWVEAAVIAEGTNIVICGRGVLSGLCWDHFMGPGNYMVNMKGSNIQLRDVTMVGAWHWCVTIERCQQVLVDGINILNGHVLNDDGIDVFRSRDVTIRDVFVRSQDDCICAKWSLEDFKVENAILWTDVANIFRIGYECDDQPARMANFCVKNVNVLHQSIQKPTEGSENAIKIQASNGMMFEDMAFEGFRFDGSEPGDNLAHVCTQRTEDQFQQHECPGYVRNVTFRNFTFPGGFPKGSQNVTLESIDDRHSVEGVRFEGFDPQIEIRSYGRVLYEKKEIMKR